MVNYMSCHSESSFVDYIFRHGTKCAGVAVAERNKKCVLGIAYDAKFAGKVC